jgi:hypothetical protein
MDKKTSFSPFIKAKLYNNDHHFHIGLDTLLHRQLLNASYDMKIAIIPTRRQNYSSSNTDGGLQTEILK